MYGKARLGNTLLHSLLKFGAVFNRNSNPKMLSKKDGMIMTFKICPQIVYEHPVKTI